MEFSERKQKWQSINVAPTSTYDNRCTAGRHVFFFSIFRNYFTLCMYPTEYHEIYQEREREKMIEKYIISVMKRVRFNNNPFSGNPR